jgi:hypothetical protein
LASVLFGTETALLDVSKQDIDTELKTTVTGLLLHSQLALADAQTPAPIAEKLRIVANLAGVLHRQLSAPVEG